MNGTVQDGQLLQELHKIAFSGGGLFPPIKSGNIMANIGYEKLAVAASAVSLASVPSMATRAYIQCDTAAVRFRYDGSAPTTAEGTLIAENGSVTLKGEDVLDAVQFIRTTSTSASLKVAYGTAGAGVESSVDAI